MRLGGTDSCSGGGAGGGGGGGGAIVGAIDTTTLVGCTGGGTLVGVATTFGSVVALGCATKVAAALVEAACSCDAVGEAAGVGCTTTTLVAQAVNNANDANPKAIRNA